MAEILMPQLGESVTEGTITQWFKKVGDSVAVDEVLFEVSTDKVDTEVPSPVAGVLGEIRAQEGDTVDVGAVIAIVGDAAGGPAAAEPGQPEAGVAQAGVAQAGVAPVGAPVPPPAPATPAPDPGPPATPDPVPAAVPVAEPAPIAVATEPVPAAGGSDVVLSPVVRRLLSESGLSASEVAGK